MTLKSLCFGTKPASSVQALLWHSLHNTFFRPRDAKQLLKISIKSFGRPKLPFLCHCNQMTSQKQTNAGRMWLLMADANAHIRLTKTLWNAYNMKPHLIGASESNRILVFSQLRWRRILTQVHHRELKHVFTASYLNNLMIIWELKYWLPELFPQTFLFV